MSKRNYYINDPKFSEYVFTVMMNTPRWAINELDLKEQEPFKNRLAMRRFADNEGLERRLLLLARLNISFTIVVAPVGYDIRNMLEETMADGIETRRRLDMIEKMARDQVFVQGSREQLIATHMSAQNSHSGLYVLNTNYTQMQGEVSRVKKDLYNLQQTKNEEAFRDLSTYILAALNSPNPLDVNAGVTQLEMRILLALYQQASTFVHPDELALKIGEGTRSLYVSRSCKALHRNGYIEHLPGRQEEDGRSSRYTIMEKGIEAVLFYLKYLVSQVKKRH